MSQYTDLHFEAAGHVEIAGQAIPYRVVSESMTLFGPDGQPDATIFSYSYLRCDLSDDEMVRRPVLFAFNGGPGASSIWLHLGLLGPTRVASADDTDPDVCPPYELINNPYCPLDAADVVLIDPIGTGYARLLRENAAQRWYGVDEDATAVAQFIEQWLNKYNRWQSPKFVLGESYGTMRACALTAALMDGPTRTEGRLRGIALDGIYLMGSAHLGGIGDRERMEISAINLPTAAATHWYHAPVTGKTLSQFVDECFSFIQDEYVRALYAGNRLKQTERAVVVEKLSLYTGLPAAYFEKTDLHLGADYLHQCCASKNADAGVYDTRYLMPHTNTAPPTDMRPGINDPVADDPAMGLYVPPFVGAMNGPKKRELGIDAPLLYKPIVFKDVNFRWNYKSAATPIQYLKMAMRRNKKLRVLFSVGYYDACTPIGYTHYAVAHAGLPMDRVSLKAYESGHMAYLGQKAACELADDLRAFIIR